MGSFAGHIDEAVFFFAIAVWWMINAFPCYIRSVWGKQEFKSRLSYKLCTRRNIPMEAILKTVFSIGTVVGEVWSRGPAFVDSEGNWRKLGETQHISIMGFFAIHGLIDIMTSYNVPLPYGLDYLSGAAAFGWFGMSFMFHARMPNTALLESMAHTLVVPIMLAVAVCLLLELYFERRSFLVHVSRIYCLLVLGTYFTQASFILFRHDTFPGDQTNPAWDQNDHRNMHFMVAAFGFHLCLNMVIVMAVYGATYGLMRLRGYGPPPKGNQQMSEDGRGDDGTEYHLLMEACHS